MGGINSPVRRPEPTRRDVLRAAGVAGAGLATSTVSGLASASSASPEVHMHPTPFSDFVPQLVHNPNQWSTVLDRIDGFGMHGHSALIAQGQDFDDMPDITRQGFSDLMTLLKQNDIPVSVEVAGPDPPDKPFDANFADRAAEATIRTWCRPIERAGYEVEYLNVDGPIRGLKKGVGATDAEERYGFDTWRRAVDEYVKWAEVVTRNRPTIKFWSIVNFLGWGWKESDDWGDYHAVAQMLLPAMVNSEATFEGIMVDYPYSGYREDPDRLIELARMVHNHNLKLNLILISMDGGEESDEAYADDVTDFAQEMHNHSSITVDRYTVESWYEHPQTVVPESDWHTMTGTTKDVIETVKGAGRGATQQPGANQSLQYIQVPENNYLLINIHSGKILTAPQSAGGNVIQQSFTGGDLTQLWRIEQLGGNRHLVAPASTNKTLDVAGHSTNRGASTNQQAWHGGPSQQWKFHTDRSLGRGVFAIINAKSGMALSVAGRQTTDGADVVQWPWYGDPSQRWIVYPV